MSKPNLAKYRYTGCRHMMHAWEHSKWLVYHNTTSLKFDRPHSELVQELQCLRCGTIRVDRFNPRSFERMGRLYVYPDGYLSEPGSGLRKRDYTAVMLAAGLKRAKEIVIESEE